MKNSLQNVDNDYFFCYTKHVLTNINKCMESYSRGRRGVPAKDVGVQKAREGSNPSLSAKPLPMVVFYCKCHYIFT